MSLLNNNLSLLRSIQKEKPTCETFDEIINWQNVLNQDDVLSILHVNIMSLGTNWDLLCCKLNQVLPKLDLLILTEVNVKKHEAPSYQLRNFSQTFKCRSRRRGGGVIVYYRDHLSIEELDYNLDEAENLLLRITHLDKNLKFVLLPIYRPPNNNVSRFLDDLNFCLQNLCKKDEMLIILGDINICTSKRSSEKVSYLNILYHNAVIPSISTPTREEMKDGVLTSSCIDHINYRLCRNDLTAISSVITEKLADHYFTGLIISKKVKNRIQRPGHLKSVNIIVNKEVERKIRQVDWDALKQVEDPVELYQKIRSQFNQIYESSIKTVVRRDKDFSFPWINARVENQIKQKNLLLQSWRKNKNNVILYEEYKRQRNITTNLIKKVKRVYIYKMFSDAQGDMMKTWKLINDLMDRKIREPTEFKLQRNFKTFDLKSLSNQFNNNFVEQVQDIRNKNSGPVLDVQVIEHKLHCENSTFLLRNASEKDIFSILQKMKKTGRGIDGIRSIDVTKSSIFIPIITHLINLMLKKSKIPYPLKSSSITPLFKKGKPDVLGNYRPVGTLPIFEKVLEKYINNQLNKYLESNKIIPTFQHGFQSGRSTITLLQEFADQINTALDERKCVVVLYLDLSFAFDTCDHRVLLKKFQDVGITHPIFAEYLKDRKQVTRLGQIFSDEVSVNQGLTQGGIVSPTWYSLYTYDVKYLQRIGSLKMFADDSCIIAIHKDVQSAISIAQRDFINLQKYLYNNQIFLNEKKTEAMIFGFKSREMDLTEHKLYCHSRHCLLLKTYESSCGCHRIEFKDEAKYLGLIIDNELKMNRHVNHLCNKLRILKYKFIKINAGSLPMSTKVTIYFSLVDSLLRYGVTLYNFAPKYALDPLNSQQRRIKNLLFNRVNIACLTPEELSSFVLLLQNFFDERYRQLTNQPYELRTQRFRRPNVFTITYGQKRTDFTVPTLLNGFCQSFLDENNKNIVKRKIKESILSKRGRIH